MAIIPDVTVLWHLSPRLIVIPVAETTVTIEDLQDTLMDLEDNVAGIVHSHLRNTSGGEELGGGTTVGWTMELQNAQLYFAARATALDYGTGRTCDATDSSGTQLYVDDADFVSSGVYAGCIVFNATTAEMATITEVVDQYTVKCLDLSGTGGNGWTLGDAYMIFPNVQCSAAGGNIVAVDSNGDELSPVLPSPNVQVKITASSSATQSEQSAIQYASYQNGVSIDADNGTSSTEYPYGTAEFPVDNLADALTIAANNGFDTLYVKGTLTLADGDNIDAYHVVGKGATINYANTTIIMLNGCSTSNTKFEDALLIGHQGGEVYGKHCVVGDGYGVDTDASQTITVDAATGKFTRSAGDFTADGFVADMMFKADGLVNNTGIYTIDTVSATEIVIYADEWSDLTNESGDTDEQLTEWKGIYNSHCEWSQCIMVGPMQMLNTPGGWESSHYTDSVNCRTITTGLQLDYNGSAFQQIYNDFSGHMDISNCTDALANIMIHMDHGKIDIDSTCTAGTITVKGIGSVVDNSNGATVDISMLVNSLDAIYKGQVFIDTAGDSGDTYPQGTFDAPVDNVTDALVLASKYNCNTLHFHSSCTVPNTADLTNLVIEGHNSIAEEVTITSGATTQDCKFKNIAITGTMSGVAEYDSCKLSDITNLAGVVKGCSLDGTITCINGSTLSLSNCKSLTQTPPEVSVGTCAVNGTNWFGFMNIDDKSGSEEFNIHCGYGYMTIGSNCTAGSMYLAGFGHSVDNSTGATVNDTDLIDPGHLNDIPDEQVHSI